MSTERQSLERAVEEVVSRIAGPGQAAELYCPDERFGDYATNVAMQLAARTNKPPRQLAEQLADALRAELSDRLSAVSVDGPGFINLTLSDAALSRAVASVLQPANSLAGQTIVIEYSDPNPFKVLHAGHLYTSVVGDAIANLLEAAGGTVHRVNFGGDVGLHVAKTMYVVLNRLGGEQPDGLDGIAADKRAEWLSECYIEGNNAYDQDESVRTAMIELNRRLYGLHADHDHSSALAQIYWTCRGWSYDYFDAFYARIGSHFDKYYPESEVAELGLATVKEQLAKGVFRESDGAVIFPGEAYGLHTRVFINRNGLPTYEAKDIGLIMTKQRDYHMDKSIVITANEQQQYMAVVLKAVEQFAPELARSTVHLTHGVVKMAGGIKMSSRLGNILRATDILDAADRANTEVTGKHSPDAVLGAVKYAFLKQRTGADVIYDPQESVAILGNTGPYLQYAHARARSILAKAAAGGAAGEQGLTTDSLEPAERLLARQISHYPDVLDRSLTELRPHHLCTYLYELAQAFNSFYEHNRVVGHDRQAVRLALVNSYADALRHGLGLLAIPSPDTM